MPQDFVYDAFVSYSHRDIEFARLLVSELEKFKIKVAIDYRDFAIGTPALKEMRRIVESSRHTIVVMSPSWVESGWSQFESLLSSTRDPANRMRTIIPLMYKEVEPPDLFSILTYIDFTKDFETAMRRLVKSIRPEAINKEIPSGSMEQLPKDQILLEVLELNKQILGAINQIASNAISSSSSIYGNVAGIVESNLCFVLMPFGPKWSRKFFDQYIKPTGEKLEFDVVRADDIYGVSGIMRDVWVFINKARIIVADLTTRNPNVFYEVGLAHAIGKDVILITQDMADVPFDLQSLRCVVYSLELDGPDKFCKDLAKTINAVLTAKP